MPLSRFFVLPLALITLPAAFAACGSASYSDTARSDIHGMASAIQRYNAAHVTGVASTGAACRQALNALGNDSFLANGTPPDNQRALGDALTHAYRSALAGFTDCADGAPLGNFVRMARANSELAEANAWIARARSLDR